MACVADCGCKGYKCVYPADWSSSAAPPPLTSLLATLLVLGCSLLHG